MELSKFLESLENHFPDFKEKCIKWMNDNWKKSTHHVVLGGFYRMNGEPKIDFDFWKDSVIRHEFKSNSLNSNDKNLLIKKLDWITDPWGTSNYSKVLVWRNTLEEKCQESFFGIASNASQFTSLFEDNIYIDGVINSDIWWNFIVGLTSHHFNSFKKVDDYRKDKVCVLKKEVSRKFEIILEFKRSEIYSELANNEPDIPEIHIYLNELQSTGYANMKNQNKRLYLGILGNPFAFPPCYPLRGYSAMVRVKNIGGIIHVGSPQDYIFLLSERTYFYIYLLKETSALYLDYLSDCAMDTF